MAVSFIGEETEFNTTAALFELYKYVLKYREEVYII
jgi:hypothetical protein